MPKPIVYDLYCGLGGWSEAFIAEGYEAIGFDIEAHDYGSGGYPGELRLRDILTLHGSELKDATCIVGSSPCQKYSYMAMPWKSAKAMVAHYADKDHPERLAELNALFNAQFRIQREASEAAGHHIPMVVENVRGAQKWVGRAVWNYGSFYLWGDVPALMPMTLKASKLPKGNASSPMWKDRPISGYSHQEQHLGTIQAFVDDRDEGLKVPGFRSDGGGKSFQTASVEGVKEGGDWWNKECRKTGMARFGSKSSKRKAASAMIAKIPFQLASHIARTLKPEGQ